MRRVIMPIKKAGPAGSAGLYLLLVSVALGQDASPSSIRSLIPEPSGWALAEGPSAYLPGTLFEYIDGAAENYLSYGFRELVVGNYKKEKSAATLTVEIYDMGDDVRAFGVYSSERYSESHFLKVGSQGYWEEGALNFIVGSYYVKLLCFDCGQGGEPSLTSIAREVEKKVPNKGQLPPLLGLFPQKGLIANSEKFILQNVLGYAFLHHGYLASYRDQEQEFDLFLIQGSSPQEAQNMMGQYLDSQRESGQVPQSTDLGFHVRDRYSNNVYLAQSGKLILGVMRIKDGFEEMGERYLGLLVQAAKAEAAGPL
jgi:hypothetical protein